MKPRIPWTREELELLIPRIESKLSAVEAEHPNARPLSPMTVAEAEAFFNRLLDLAWSRPLTQEERFLHGQLVAVYRSAVIAETLGHRGRFFVIPESAIDGMLKEPPCDAT